MKRDDSNIFSGYEKLIFAMSEKSDGSMKIYANESEQDLVFENRKIFLKRKGIEMEATAGAYLVHGANVKSVEKGDRGKFFEMTDGLVTKEKDIFLTVTTSDCLPVFFFDSQNEIVGLVHAGWSGLEKEIIKIAILKMEAIGGQKEKILAFIGPGIEACHYEVGKDLSEKFSAIDGALQRKNGRFFLDIKKIAYNQLLEAGVLLENIEISKHCTFCEKEKYFSYRRDAYGQMDNLQAMLAVIGMKSV